MPRKTGDQINLGLHAIDNDAVDLSHEIMGQLQKRIEARRTHDLVIPQDVAKSSPHCVVKMGHHVLL